MNVKAKKEQKHLRLEVGKKVKTKERLGKLIEKIKEKINNGERIKRRNWF